MFRGNQTNNPNAFGAQVRQNSNALLGAYLLSRRARGLQPLQDSVWSLVRQRIELGFHELDEICDAVTRPLNQTRLKNARQTSD